MLRHAVALASGKLTHVGNGGQLMHLEVIMSRSSFQYVVGIGNA